MESAPRLRYAANCSIPFTELPLLERPEAAARSAGFAAVESWWPFDSVPIMVEVIFERITNVSMGTELDNVVEFDELDDMSHPQPTVSGPRDQEYRR